MRETKTWRVVFFSLFVCDFVVCKQGLALCAARERNIVIIFCIVDSKSQQNTRSNEKKRERKKKMPYFKSTQNVNPGPSIAAAIASRYTNKVRAAQSSKKEQQQQQQKNSFKYKPSQDDFVFYYPKAPSFDDQIAL